MIVLYVIISFVLAAVFMWLMGKLGDWLIAIDLNNKPHAVRKVKYPTHNSFRKGHN